MLCGYRMSAALRLLELCAWQWQLLLGSSQLVPTHRSHQPALIQGTAGTKMGSRSLLFQTAFFRHCLQLPTSRRSPPQGRVSSAPTRPLLPWATGTALLGTGQPVCKAAEEERSGPELRAAAAGRGQRSRSSCSNWLGVPLCSPTRSSALLDDEQRLRLSSRQRSSSGPGCGERGGAALPPLPAGRR